MQSDVQIKNILRSIGEKFKAAREAKGATVEQVQQDTHFHHNVIVALEEGRAGDLLGQTYLKSYLKKYAGYLGLNTDELLREYINYQSPATQQKIEIKRVDRLDGAQGAIAFYLPRIVMVIIALALLYGGSILLRKGTVAIGHRMRVAREERAAKIRQRPKKAVTRQKPSKKTTSVNSGRSSDFMPVSISKNKPLRLAIDVNKPVLLMAASDGEILFTNVLRTGTIETVIAKSKITLWIKDASAVELTLNGNYIGSPGKGEIKNLEITHKGIEIVK